MNTFMSPATPRAMALSPSVFPLGAELPGEAPATPLSHLGNLFRRRWLLIVCCALAAAVLAGGLAFRMPRLFTAWGQVVIIPQEAQANAGPNVRGADEVAMTIETQVSVLQSRDLAARVLGRLLETPTVPILEFAQEGSARRAARWFADEIIQNPGASQFVTSINPDWTKALDSIAAVPNPRQRREMMIDELLRNLKVNSEPRSRVVSVRYTAQTPELAALIVNTVVETYIAAQKSNKRDGIRQEIARLDKRLPALRAELETANAQIRAFRLAHAVPDMTNGDVQEQQAVALKRAINAVLAAQAQAASTPGAEAQSDMAMLAQRQEALQKQLDALQATLGDMQPAADHLKELIRLMEAKRQIYEEGLLERQKLVQSQDLVAADAFVLSAAAPPQKPTSTSPALFLPPALVAGLLIGGVVAIWREAADSGVRSERLIPNLFGISCAGFLPVRSRFRKGSGAALHAAALRFIATTVLHTSARGGCQSLLVTSSVSGEGSTALSEALARHAAALMSRVLLVDLQSHEAGLPRGVPCPKVQEAVADSGNPADPLSGTVLTCPYADSDLNVFRSHGVDSIRFGRDLPEILKRLREAYDCIVIHAGPLLESTDARVLASEVDQILLAIRWGRTPRAIIENALGVLFRIEGGVGKPNSISAVLTEVHVKRHLAYRFNDAIEALARVYRRRIWA